MDCSEFSNAFDVAYNNIMSNQAPGLDEYEKSVFLTKAQDEIVKNYFSPKGNPKQEGYDDSKKRQIDFSGIMRYVRLENKSADVDDKFDSRALLYTLPTDLFLIINEQVQFASSTTAKPSAIRNVIPISYAEYDRLMSKPYKYPLKWQAWRMFTQVESDDRKVAEIILNSQDEAKYSSMKTLFCIRYVKRPQPIVLVNLTSAFGEDLKIHGISAQTECELDEELHEDILQRAVELARIAYGGDLNQAQLEMTSGQRSE